MEALEKLLQRERSNFNNALIVSESVFSMDGDIADLKKLVELKKNIIVFWFLMRRMLSVYSDVMGWVLQKQPG